MQSLFDRIGGAAPVHAVTAQFYANINADAEVSDFFKGVNMESQINKTSSFLCCAFGGPAYAGKDMVEVHKNLGINNAKFDKVIGHLKSALTGAGVNAELTNEVLAVAETTRPTVVFA